MKKLLSLLLTSCVLAACSNAVDMTYYSDPAGATIYEQGMGKLGVAPVVVRYSPTQDEINQGRFNTGKVTAVWVSGASVSVPSVSADIASDKKASYAFIRPQDAPGYNADITFATTVEKAHVVNPPKDDFDLLDKSLTCGWFNLIDATYADCD